MSAQGGRRLQPIAVLAALVLLVWGLLGIASVVALIQINTKFHWQSLSTWSGWANALALAASGFAALAVLWGLLGLRSRVALHLGGLTAVVSIALTVAGLALTNGRPSGDGRTYTWSRIAEAYRHGILWDDVPGDMGLHRWWYFVNDILLPLAVVVLLMWLVVLLTGAGRRRPAPGGTGYAYVTAPQEDYRYVVAGTPATVPAAAEPERAPSEDAQAAEETAQTEPSAVEPEPAAETDEPVDGPDELPDGLRAELPDESEAPAAAQVPAAPDGAPAAPGDHEAVWFVTIQGNDHGPYTRTQLRGYLAEGRLHAGTLTHLAGEDTRPLADVLG